jgi:crotonobetainyl-CoA:carnitine CoA-transferase CaiB-like acyl-CoA transferase
MSRCEVPRPDGREPLGRYRICDLSGQVAGAGATRILASLGAQVIRVEDPVTQGRWDILRRSGPYLDEHRGVDHGGGFNNYNADKLGVTLNLRDPRGRQLLQRLVRCCDVVTENFRTGVLDGLGFSYEELKLIKPDIILVSNSGFGHDGPYSGYRSWGPVIQAVGGLTHEVGLPSTEPAGWGYSFMDHIGAAAGAMSILAALVQREHTGRGQAIDLSAMDLAVQLLGPALMDVSVNRRPRRRDGRPDSNRSEFVGMVPHGVYPVAGEDCWIALACRDDADWQAMRSVIDQPWAFDCDLDAVSGRRAAEDRLSKMIAAWTATRHGEDTALRLRQVGVPASVVARPRQRIEEDPATTEWGLWPAVDHPNLGRVRVDGLGFHLSATDWATHDAAPCLGQHNRTVFGELLGLTDTEIDVLAADGVI